ncbi:unannotated protein [freshwater metagenome]|uniref:Unannotated protein n=1 Tax=freshwater metagenome TaxID=449393 RepID=A0A6J7E9R5_9ZZZZ|nr:hypothetical protein [Actinomycetota bacterium]
MDKEKLLRRAGERGVNPFVHTIVRGLLIPFFRVYFRLNATGREALPKSGGVIFAPNHRSFLDPFVIAAAQRRPVYFIAKKELFLKNRLQSWLLNSVGAFPIDRGSGDAASIDTARAILERGDCVMVFPEGTRVRPGPLGHPRRGFGRLALECGVPVVPVTVFGTDDIRRGWRVRPHRVRVAFGEPIGFPRTDQPSPALAKSVSDRVWPRVEQQWESFGGIGPVRRAAIIGAGSWGTSLAVVLSRSGVAVELGCRSAEQAQEVAERRENRRYLPGVELPQAIAVMRAVDLDPRHADVVCLAVPAGALPVVMAELGDRLGDRPSLLVMSKGLVAPGGELPSAFCAARAGGLPVACLGGPAHAADALEHGASIVLAGVDANILAQLRRVFVDAGFDVETSRDITGVDLAGVAKNAAVLAAATAAISGPNASGAAAGKVFAEVAAYATALGADPRSWSGLAGAGDLVASVVAAGGRNRRAGEMLARGVPASDVQPALGQVAEALDTLPLLADAMRRERIAAPAVSELARVVAGEGSAAAFAEHVTRPRRIVGARVV